MFRSSIIRLSALLAAVVMSSTAASPPVPPHAVIFMYHRFGDPRYPSTSTDTRQFAAQLDWLRRNHYQVWPLPRVVDDLRSGTPIPDHVVAITVDGAFRSMYEDAYPLLKSRRLPFTLFVSSDDVDRHRPDFMTWSDLRSISQHGGTIANDSADSAHLAFRSAHESREAWSARVKADILRGQERLQAELGPLTNTKPKLIAYPYGEFNRRLARLVNRLGFVAFGQESGVAAAPLDIRAVPRFPLNQHYGSVAEFAIRAAAMPMPTQTVQPWDPEVSRDNPPQMQVTLLPGIVPEEALHCYLNGPPLNVSWSKTGLFRFTVKAPSALAAGHYRYDCTALVNGRYYWYSHMWLVPPGWTPARPLAGQAAAH